MPRILMHVQHLLGTGHQRRGAAIARALAARGAEVTYASGGMTVPGLDVGRARFVQLPPARVGDARYAGLVDETGRALDEAWRSRRRDGLLDLLDAVRPDAVVLETYPFGRKLLRFELRPLLERIRRMRPRPVVACSIREVLEPRDDPARYEAMADEIESDFDLVLVHGDPTVFSFGEIFGAYARIASRVVHTGYVAEQPVAADRCGDGSGVLVSAGGGAVGVSLLEAAVASARLARPGGESWRILVGPGVAPARARELRERAPAGVVVEPNRADFPALLRRCRVSVSQAGYNTMTDVLAAGARAVVVPFGGAGEREQGIRARRFAARGLVTVLDASRIDADALAEAVAAASRRPRPLGHGVSLDGAARAARCLLRAVRGR